MTRDPSHDGHVPGDCHRHKAPQTNDGLLSLTLTTNATIAQGNLVVDIGKQCRNLHHVFFFLVY
jgi:hypothetical protein